MSANDKLVETYNDLIRINNDRIEGYEKAIKEADDLDVDLKTIFSSMADESRKYKSELTSAVGRLGGEIADGTTGMGKIYRVWMDVKATFSGHSREAVLENCEFGEDAAQRAYEDALGDDAEMTAEDRQLITEQKRKLKESHDKIKGLRDAQRAAND